MADHGDNLAQLSFPREWFEALLAAPIPGRHKDALLALAFILWDQLTVESGTVAVKQIQTVIASNDGRQVRRLLDDLSRWNLIERTGGRQGRAARYEIVTDATHWMIDRTGRAGRTDQLPLALPRAPAPQAEHRTEAPQVPEAVGVKTAQGAGVRSSPEPRAPAPEEHRAPAPPSCSSTTEVQEQERTLRTSRGFKVPAKLVAACWSIQDALTVHDGPVVPWTRLRCDRLGKVLADWGDDAGAMIVHGYWVRHQKGADWSPEKTFTFDSLFRPGGRGAASNAEQNLGAAMEAERRGWTSPYAYKANIRWKRGARKNRTDTTRVAQTPEQTKEQAAFAKLTPAERRKEMNDATTRLPDSQFRRERLRRQGRPTE